MLGFKSEIVIKQNVKSGIRAVMFDESDLNVSIRKDSRILCMARRSHTEEFMHQYGTSKVMHWNDHCAKPNANRDSTKIKMIDGLLKGHTVCRNCWDRTRTLQN